MIDELLLHPLTKKNLANLLRNPTNAIGIEGDWGAGKFDVAKYIATDLLGKDDIISDPNVVIVDCSGKVGIENIREIIQFLALKVPGSQEYKRAIILKSVDSLSMAAQNALLKSIEEPPDDTLIIVTVEDRDQLLKTTASRFRWIKVLSLDLEMIEREFSKNFSSDLIKKAYFLSEGNMRHFVEIISDKNNDMLAMAGEIKDFLKRPKFERLAKVDQILKAKDFSLNKYLIILRKVLNASIKSQINKNIRINSVQIHQLELINNAIESTNYNCSEKIIFTNFVYNL